MSQVNTQPTMEDLLNHLGNQNELEIGSKIKGEIISITKNEVIVDLPNVGLGIIRGRELYNEEYLAHLKIGEEVEAIILALENENGMVELSFRAVGRDKIVETIKQLHQENATVEAKIRDANRGGFLVKVAGIYGFLPASLLSPTHTIKQTQNMDNKNLVSQMKKYVGQTFNVKILSVNEENDTVVVSEKAVSDEIAVAKISKYKIGDIVEGKVVGTVDFGLFVRFDEDLEGLVHISEMAWKKVLDAKLEHKVGDIVKAKIVDIDTDSRINLSIKQTQLNPWEEFIKTAKVGGTFTGEVVKIVSYGAIIHSEEGVQGLLHITQIKAEGLNSPADIHEHLKAGETKDFTILSLAGDKLFLTLLPLKTAQKIEKVEQERVEREKAEKEAEKQNENK